jgi:polysaccharide export outer membrane protein
MRRMGLVTGVTATMLLASAASAQQPANGKGTAGLTARAAGVEAVAKTPADYTIGAGDLLNIVFWREPEMSGDVVVRPDGKITLPLIKEVIASGLTPAQLETELANLAKRYIQEPNATVVVREIRSRQVFITGNVRAPGAYPLSGPTTVLQFIAQAGGLLEYADAEGVRIMRTAGGTAATLKFNYKDITKGRNLAQNIELRPGDTVIVP